jgi:hypothetical protein
MARSRKTIEMATVLDLANDMLRKSADDKVEARLAIASMIEKLLMDTENYKGFCFTDGNNGRTDGSRRQYYRSSNLMQVL